MKVYKEVYKVRLGDAALSAASLYIGRGRLLFARLVGGDQETRALRKAIREGLRAAIYAPWSALPDYVSLDPAVRLHSEAVWIQGLPRVRNTLYLPVFREGEQTWYFFLPGSGPGSGDLAEELEAFIEAVTPYPTPGLSGLPPAQRGRILDRLFGDRERYAFSRIPAQDDPESFPRGILMPDRVLREILVDLARQIHQAR